MTYRLGILADDLTGLAAAVSEAALGGARAVIGGLEDAIPDTPIWGLNVNCRELSPQEARARTTAGIARLHDWGARDVVLKIDSFWRGNPDAMIEAACDTGAVAVFNDRFDPHKTPRVTASGPLGVASRLDLVRSARRAGIRLWVGGLGLARPVIWSALQDPSPVLLVIGSQEAIARTQIDHCRNAGVQIHDTEGLAVPGRLQALISEGESVLVADKSGAVARCNAAAAERQYAIWAEILRHAPVEHCAGLVLSGGHTASAILGRFSTTALQVTGDTVEHGLPISQALNGDWAGSLIATKPGHFGSPSTLMSAVMVIQILSASRSDG